MMVFLFLNVFLACQSYRSAMGVICNAPVDCTKCSQSDVYQRRDQLAQHIDAKLKNKKARRFLNTMPSMGPEERTRVLNVAAAKNGLKSCPLAAELQD